MANDSSFSDQPREFLAAVVDSTGDSIITIDLSGTITTWNAAAEKLYGYPRREAVGKPLTILTLPSDLALVFRRIDQVINTQKGETVDTVRIHKDGRELWLNITFSPVKNESGELIGISTIARDVTSRKLDEEKSRENSQRLRMILENAREYAIFSLALDRTVTSWNAGAKKILGYEEDEIVGKSGDVIFTAQDREAGAPEKESSIAVSTGKASDERWHQRKDGSQFWGSGVMMLMRDPEEKPIGLVKIFRDQTEEVRAKKALEESLMQTERAREEAEAAVRAKDQFFAFVSHELRTPLMPIVMAIEMISRNDGLSDANLDALKMIKRNVQLESRFIDDLLDVTRISNGKLELAVEEADVHEVVRHALDVTGPDIDAKNQILTVSLEATKHRVNGDSCRLQQVFWNLLKNAAKFTPDGGGIKIRSWNEGSTVGARESLFIEVLDTGIGFEPALGEEIFVPFAQGGAFVTRKFGGLGLGLAISKAVVDAHGGILTAQSSGPGTGAVFRVELPLS